MPDEQFVLPSGYSEIGYKCLRVSSTEKKGLNELKALMVGKVSMFSGHSGVGKSTLVNALEPSLQPVSYTHLDVYKRQKLYW